MIESHPERSPILDAAFNYINTEGWTILAVGNDKRPLGVWGPGGTNRYDYTNADRVYQLGNIPGIAVVTGPSRLVIIDLDNEEAIRAWAERFGTPLTRVVKTPRGRHLYFQAPPGLHIPPGTEILPGVDVRGGESYAILPPSNLAASYTWANQNPILPLPDEITSLVTNHRAKRRDHIISGKPFTEGGRNDHIFSMADTMRKGGFDHSSILAALIETNKTRCIPPLSIREIEGIAESAARYEAGDPHGLDLIDHLRAQTATRDTDDEPVLTTHAKLLNTHKLVTEDPEPIDWIWEDFLAPGTLNMLHGEGGLGKSYLALKIAEQVLNHTPTPVFGKPIRPGNVIILDGENAESQIHRRIQNTTITADANLSVYVVTDPILGLDEYTEQYIDHLVTQHDPTLIIIDSQRALWHGDEKEAGEAGRMLRRFARYIERHACAFLLIHHDNRGGDYSGSSDINAAITGCRIHLRRHNDKDKPNARILTQPKNRIAQEIAPQEFLLEITHQPDSHRFVDSGIRLVPFVRTEKVEHDERVEQAITLLHNPSSDGGIMYRDLWAAYGFEYAEDGIKNKTQQELWNRIREDLIERGYVSKTGQGGGRIVKCET